MDDGVLPGQLGSSLSNHLLLNAMLDLADPIGENIATLSDPELFGFLEVLWEVIAKPLAGRHHDWSNCGWHYSTFDKPAGQAELVERLNPILNNYDSGFVMTSAGRIELLLPEEAAAVLTEPLPAHTPPPVQKRVATAVERFRRATSSWEDRHAAVRELGDALEFLRSEATGRLTTRDESDLFNILNNFGLRHLNDRQKTEYDQPIYLKWMFYHFLAAIQACLELTARPRN